MTSKTGGGRGTNQHTVRGVSAPPSFPLPRQTLTGPRIAAAQLANTPVPLAALTGNDIEGIREDLQSYGIDPDTAQFALVEVPLTELAGWVCAPESYLEDGDEDGYVRVIALGDAYASDPDDIPPVVAAHLDGLQVFDGCYRVNGAALARLDSVPTWMLMTADL